MRQNAPSKTVSPPCRRSKVAIIITPVAKEKQKQQLVASSKFELMVISLFARILFGRKSECQQKNETD